MVMHRGLVRTFLKLDGSLVFDNTLPPSQFFWNSPEDIERKRNSDIKGHNCYKFVDNDR